MAKAMEIKKIPKFECINYFSSCRFFINTVKSTMVPMYPQVLWAGKVLTNKVPGTVTLNMIVMIKTILWYNF